MKNIFNQPDYETITIRINKITPAFESLWGKMDVHQMVIHLKDQLDIALGNMSAAAQGPFLFRTLPGRWLSLYIIPWRKGKEETPREMNAKFKGNVVTDFESDKHLLLLRLAEFRDQETFAAHPFFGTLSRRDWGRLVWIHVNHHLTQFGI